MTIDKDLIKEVQGAVDYVDTHCVDAILDQAVEIQRVQSLQSGSWETVNYIVVLTVGGPHIELDLGRDAIDGYWGGAEAHLPISNSKSRELWELISEL